MAMQNLDAEQAVIGACIIDPSLLERIAEKLKPRDFTRIEHGVIWQAILASWHAGESPDLVTLSERLEDNFALRDIGGLDYLAQVVRDTPGTGNAEVYARIVADLAQRRHMLDVITNLGESVRDTETPLREALSSAQGQMVSLYRPDGEQAKPIKETLEDLIDILERRWNGEEAPQGLTFGLADLDKRTYGMHPGDLILVAGRPSMGKTTFLINILAACAVNEGAPGILFSHEMPAEQVRDRLVANVGNIPLNALIDPKENMTDEYWARLGAAITRIKESPIIIDDRSGLTPSQMRSVALRWREHYGAIAWIGVDYLQLVRAESRKSVREQEVAEVSRMMKELAKEMKCPVIALSQLNRSLESRADKRPIMSDLRESGALEQDADILIFLYRDEIYNENTQAKNTAEIIIGKQRQGSVGTVVSAVNLAHCKFMNMTFDEQKRIRGLTQSVTVAKSPYSED